jgi:hypothetical protein
MKNFDKIKKGSSIYWEFKPSNVTDRVTIGEMVKISLRAQGIGGYTNTSVTSPADIFLPTDHVIDVSKIVIEAQESFYKGFHNIVSDKISDMFVIYWKSLCRAEGKEALYKTRKAKFDAFVTEITKTKETIKAIKVLGIPFVEIQ